MNKIRNSSKLQVEAWFISLFMSLKEHNLNLYKKYRFLNNPKYWYKFCFCLNDSKYKRLNYLKRQAKAVLSALLQESSSKLIWNLSDGFLDIKATGSSIYIILEFRKLLILSQIKKRNTLARIISILEEIGFLEILRVNKRGYDNERIIEAKLNLIQFDQSMRLVEMNEYNNNIRCIDNINLLVNIMNIMHKDTSNKFKND